MNTDIGSIFIAMTQVNFNVHPTTILYIWSNHLKYLASEDKFFLNDVPYLCNLTSSGMIDHEGIRTLLKSWYLQDSAEETLPRFLGLLDLPIEFKDRHPTIGAFLVGIFLEFIAGQKNGLSVADASFIKHLPKIKNLCNFSKDQDSIVGNWQMIWPWLVGLEVFGKPIPEPIVWRRWLKTPEEIGGQYLSCKRLL